MILKPWFEPTGEASGVCLFGDIEGSEGSGLAIRQMPGWVSVYSAAAMLPAELLRTLARAAGVRLYSDRTDEVWACRDMLAVHAGEAGVRSISLPAPRMVSEWWTGKCIEQPVETFPCEFEQNGTALFFLR